MKMNDLPPCDLAAEQRLLGHLLADNRHLEGLWWLSPGHFVDPLHALIFAAILERVEAGQLADAATLRDVFAGTQVLEEVGGVVYLTQLLTAVYVDLDDQSAVGDSGSRIANTWRERQRINCNEALRAGGVPAPR
jgi:replicative DNA helicase